MKVENAGALAITGGTVGLRVWRSWVNLAKAKRVLGCHIGHRHPTITLSLRRAGRPAAGQPGQGQARAGLGPDADAAGAAVQRDGGRRHRHAGARPAFKNPKRRARCSPPDGRRVPGACRQPARLRKVGQRSALPCLPEPRRAQGRRMHAEDACGWTGSRAAVRPCKQWARRSCPGRLSLRPLLGAGGPHRVHPFLGACARSPTPACACPAHAARERPVAVQSCRHMAALSPPRCAELPSGAQRPL